VLQGASNNFEQNLIRTAWSSDGERVGCGSADRNVYVWDVDSERLLYALPGHTGTCGLELSTRPRALRTDSAPLQRASLGASHLAHARPNPPPLLMQVSSTRWRSTRTSM
jgi:WD40 repeat protein